MTDATANEAEGPSLKGPTKLDPETLVLRGKPRRVVRFRRGAIIALSALVSTGIVGVAWVALKPATFLHMVDSEGSRDPASRRPPDELAHAPKTYGDVPKLGPPLPGDLGGPILAHERAIGGTPIVDHGANEAQQIAQAAEAERQRIAAERKAARESGVMVQRGAAAPVELASRVDIPPVPTIPLESVAGTGPADAGRDQNAQAHKAAFANAASADSPINPHALSLAPSPWTISAGNVIAASLVTGLNSDLPGLVIAQVTQNVYDSATGRTVLIPQGSRLIGRYDSVVAFGQKRALVVWQRIIMPDGSSITLDNAPTTDASGYAGLADKIDRHSWALLKGVALSTLLGVGTQLSLGSTESDLVRAIRESAQQNAATAGQQITSKNLDIQPTITVRPGWPVRIVVHKDLILVPWKG